jgi:hypothetical protein
MSALSFSSSFPGHRIVLHFDINKTILISDAASGVSTRAMLNSLVSECVWGSVPAGVAKSDRKVSDWALIDATPSLHAPRLSGTENEPLVVTFGEYIEDYTSTSRADRKRIKSCFTEAGSVGAPCQSYVDMLDTALQHRSDLTATASRSVLPEPFDGYYHLLPSFFTLVTTLHRRRADFRIVFRTFGVDIAAVSKEFNAFCEGIHPLFPLAAIDRMDGTGRDGVDRRLRLPDHSGKLLRCGDNAADVFMAYVQGDKVRFIYFCTGYAFSSVVYTIYCE